MSDVKLLYITVPNESEAAEIARQLLESQLIACANIITGIRSMYWWEGSIQQESECVLICKTVNGLIDEAIDGIKRLHSYSCPCVLTIAVESGNLDFLSWLKASVREVNY